MAYERKVDLTLCFHVPSRTEKRKGTVYDVTRFNDGSWECSCMAFTFTVNRDEENKTCKHIEYIRQKIMEIEPMIKDC